MEEEASEHRGLGSAGKLNWMYDGPGALVDREDYLLGRKVDKSLQYLEEAEKGNSSFNYADEVEKDLTPMPLFAKPAREGPIDVIRKIKEDPLYHIQKKEEENMRELLKNPVRMKQLQDMVEERERLAKKSSKHHKKKSKRSRRDSSSSEDDPRAKRDKDRLLAEKLKALKEKLKRGSSDSSDSSDSSSERSPKKYKKTASYHERHSSSSKSHSSSKNPPRYDDSRGYKEIRHDSRGSREFRDDYKDDRRRGNDSSGSRRDSDRRERLPSSREPNFDRPQANKSHRESSKEYKSSDYRSYNRDRGEERRGDRVSSSSSTSRPSSSAKRGLDEAEKAEKLREMMENAKWRDEQRTKSVNKFREDAKKEEDASKRDHEPDFINKQLLEAANSGSVEKRIKSNSYNIQRSKGAMDTNFARR